MANKLSPHQIVVLVISLLAVHLAQWVPVAARPQVVGFRHPESNGPSYSASLLSLPSQAGTISSVANQGYGTLSNVGSQRFGSLPNLGSQGFGTLSNELGALTTVSANQGLNSLSGANNQGFANLQSLSSSLSVYNRGQGGFVGGSLPSASLGFGAGGQVARFTAKPGSVLVHFDRSHEIQRLQYVLQDGRLATLYQRAQLPNGLGATSNVSPNVGRSPNLQQPSNMQSSQPATAAAASSSSGPTLQRRGDLVIGGLQALPTERQDIDDDQTIEILDDKMRGVGQLVGDHVTFELPVEQGLSTKTIPPPTPSGATIANGAASAAGSGVITSNDKVDVLATIAADAIQSGALQAGETKLRKAGVFVDKLKGKLSQKLLELPDIIGAKLRAKSSKGQMFIDQAGNEVQVIENNSSSKGIEGAALQQISDGGGYPVQQQQASIGMRSGLEQQQQQQQQQIPKHPKPANQRPQNQNQPPPQKQQQQQNRQQLLRLLQQQHSTQSRNSESEATVVTPAQLASQGPPLGRHQLTN